MRKPQSKNRQRDSNQTASEIPGAVQSADIGREAYGWESWPDIPRNAWLISFTDDRVDGLRADDPLVYRTRPEYGKSLMKWVEPVRSRSVDGFRVPGIREWKQRLEAYKDGNLRSWQTAGICLQLDRFFAGN
jgi:hypothetical protein